MRWSTVKRMLPTICTVVGVLGVPATSALSVWGYTKHLDALVKEELPMSGKDEFKIVWKYYLPAVLSGVVSIGAIIASNRLNKREITALAAAAAYLGSRRKIAENQIEATYDPDDEALDEIRREAVVEAAKHIYSPKSVEETGYGDVLCFEGYSGRWFRSDPKRVDQAINLFRSAYHNGKGYSCCLNDLYELLGIEKTHFGYQMGWPGIATFGSREYLELQYGIYYEDIYWYCTTCSAEEMGTGESVYVLELMQDSYPVSGWYEY